MKNEELVTGVINSDKNPVLFTVPKGKFNFALLTDTIYDYRKNNIPTHLTIKDKFVFGTTHDNRNIAIYVGNDSFELLTHALLSPGAYIISSQNIDENDFMKYDVMEFRGKVLSQVTDIYKLRSNPIHHSIETNEYIFELSIHLDNESLSQQTYNEVVLEICFKTPQPLLDCFTHYNRIAELISFLSYRNDIYFNHIILKQMNPILSTKMNKSISVDFAEVYVNDIKEDSCKHYYNNICFEDIGTSLPQLIKIFYDINQQKPSYCLGFIPNNDVDLNIMSHSKIKDICTALECEYALQKDNNSEENTTLIRLIEETKQFVKEFKKNNPQLSDNTYNLIFSSIKNWTFTATEKSFFLYEKFRNEIGRLNGRYFRKNNNDINEVIKYRNDITHGSHRIMNQEIAVTAQALAAVVYCCILLRIGITKEKIGELCADKKLLQ